MKTMASFASSATTGGACKHAWTKILFTQLASDHINVAYELLSTDVNRCQEMSRDGNRFQEISNDLRVYSCTQIAMIFATLEKYVFG